MLRLCASVVWPSNDVLYLFLDVLTEKCFIDALSIGASFQLGRLFTPSGPDSIPLPADLASNFDFFFRDKLFHCFYPGSGGSDPILTCIGPVVARTYSSFYGDK